MFVLLLLSVCVATGFSYDERHYGDTWTPRFNSRVKSIEFTPTYRSNGTVLLWDRDDHPVMEDKRMEVNNNKFEMKKIKIKDVGTYVMKDKNKKDVFTNELWVNAIEHHYSRMARQQFDFLIDLDSENCNIFFHPDSESESFEIIHRGNVNWAVNQVDCKEFYVKKPCGVQIDYLLSSCRGYFEVIDSYGDIALTAHLEVDDDDDEDVSTVGVSIGSIMFGLASCIGVIRCCKGGCSSAKREALDDDEAAQHCQENDREPSAPMLSEPSHTSVTHDAPPPSYSQAVPLRPYPQTEIMPPPYAEVAGPAEPADAPSVPLNSDSEVQFELQGAYSSVDPLGLDSAVSSVYTSEKLNFL